MSNFYQLPSYANGNIGIRRAATEAGFEVVPVQPSGADDSAAPQKFTREAFHSDLRKIKKQLPAKTSD